MRLRPLEHYINPNTADTCPACTHDMGMPALCQVFIGCRPDGSYVISRDGVRLDADEIESAMRMAFGGGEQ